MKIYIISYYHSLLYTVIFYYVLSKNLNKINGCHLLTYAAIYSHQLWGRKSYIIVYIIYAQCIDIMCFYLITVKAPCWHSSYIFKHYTTYIYMVTIHVCIYIYTYIYTPQVLSHADVYNHMLSCSIKFISMSSSILSVEMITYNVFSNAVIYHHMASSYCTYCHRKISIISLSIIM